MVQSDDRRIGAIISGRYRLLSIIGSGGMGVVYRAEHLLLKKDVALKVLHAHLRDHPRQVELAQRFLREAQSLALLDQQHPHIVQIVDCGLDSGMGKEATLFMAMELCEGETLSQVLGRGTLPPSRALHIVVQVLRALVHAHGRGIIHRDLKPENVMLTRRDGCDDFVKIFDFGIAKLLSDTSLAPEPRGAEDEPAPTRQRTGGDAGGSRSPASLTRAGTIFGTPEYLAPEQAQGGEVDQRTDLYAVGVMLWELLVGRRPFVADTALQVIGLQLLAVPEAPSRHVAGLPASLDRIVLRAMEKRPEDRFASAQEFLHALDGVLEEMDGRSGARGGLAARLRRVTGAAAGQVPRLITGAATAAAILAGLLGSRFLAGRAAHGNQADVPLALPPAVSGELSRAEGLLARGRLREAGEILDRSYARYPDSPRVNQLRGHLHAEAGDEAAALSDYREALRQDRAYRVDSTLLRNLGRFLDSPALGDGALHLLQEQVGEPALPLFYDCARTCKDPARREAAARAAAAMGAPLPMRPKG